MPVSVCIKNIDVNSNLTDMRTIRRRPMTSYDFFSHFALVNFSHKTFVRIDYFAIRIRLVYV